MPTVVANGCETFSDVDGFTDPRRSDVETVRGPRLMVQSLILAPANSPITPLEDQIAMRQGIADARLAVIEGPGHEIYVDRPEECLAALMPRCIGGRPPIEGSHENGGRVLNSDDGGLAIATVTRP